MLPAVADVRGLPARFAPAAAAFEAELVERVMPYWYDTTLDQEHGGYLLADDAVLPVDPPATKMIVTQARMVWGFAHAHRNGIRDPGRDYLAAAAQGYRFLIEKFRDPEHGGYYWLTDRAGNPLDDGKFLYGQAFVIYALVEYYRASGERAALDQAVDLYRTVHARAYDQRNGGWWEQAHADWEPLAAGEPSTIGIAGLKSDNAHLHWLEALIELFEVTRPRPIRTSFGAPLRLAKVLREALRINRTYFYPRRPARSTRYRAADWRRIAEPHAEQISYGHLVEFAWLMVRAERALGRRPSWGHFRALVDHALEHGYDHQRGGVYDLGIGAEPAFDTDKIWWVQAEMLAALTVGLRRRSDPDHTRALEQLLSFLRAHQIDPQDGIWLDTLAADGTPLLTGKAHQWKAAYHDLRALLMFIDAH